ncbi:hypothetical protein CYPRO_1527 [Cyclonatronum proteinivorum]|uniref:CAAX prenyl protease 2/Lysostaphin resistance protein A-like domain-containing protein n=1 Tax=Cyclonatronum proteinivorum TaxID=1457365 RepID=A0A345UJX6_9BACT|nr:type II CAAX endopeptidase family protein [Cyclonatronum proteinivorum]AXJ00778.1 hypothetical protein CYPRO_1527 [Cyclonatronum proteinivorum]
MEPKREPANGFNPYIIQVKKPWFERNGFPDWLVAFAWIFIAFLIFQLVGGLFAFAGILLTEGVDSFTMESLGENMALLIIGNSAGQIVGLLLATLLVARLSFSKSKYREAMRFKMPQNASLTFLVATLLILVIQPLILFMGWMNQLIPMPEFIMEMEQAQVQMLESLLVGSFALWFLVANIGVVPAICEEVMFRSYLHRLFENAYGIIAAIFITGLIFGLFHLRLTQLIPLTFIGMVLGWITVKSGSVYPAMLMHFFHNSGTVAFVHSNPDMLEMAESAMMPPLWLVASSLILTVYLIYLYSKRSEISLTKTE